MAKVKASKENAKQAADHLTKIKEILVQSYGIAIPSESLGPEPSFGERFAFVEEFLAKCAKKLPSEKAYDDDKKRKKGKKKEKK